MGDLLHEATELTESTELNESPINSVLSVGPVVLFFRPCAGSCSCTSSISAVYGGQRGLYIWYDL